MTESLKEEIKTFKGQDFTYHEIAFRGKEILGVCFNKGVNPVSGVILLLVRFVSIVPESAYLSMCKYTHFTPRGEGAYMRGEKATVGWKLNHAVIPLFTGVPCPHLLQGVGDKHQIWPIIAGWLMEQLEKEGFVCTVLDLPGFVRDQFHVSMDNIEMLMEMPDLNAQPQLEAGDDGVAQ